MLVSDDFPRGNEQITDEAPNVLFYYTSTGNSLWLARLLARQLGNTKLVSMTDPGRLEEWTEPAPRVGLVFPVHAWGLPRRVLGFLEQLEKQRPAYCFALACHAGQVSNTLVQLAEALKQRELTLSAGWEFKMPDNYIIWAGALPLDKQRERFRAAATKIGVVAALIAAKTKLPPEKGPLWQRIILSALYRAAFPHFPQLDKYFNADARCNQCGLCVKICPTQNITLIDEKLTWRHRCEQCLACIQWCPQEALQFGKRTRTFTRYRHPEITVKDLIIPAKQPPG